MIWDPNAERVKKSLEANKLGYWNQAIILSINIPYIIFFRLNVRLNTVIERKRMNQEKSFFNNVKNQLLCQIIIQAALQTFLAIHIEGAKVLSLQDDSVFGHLRKDNFLFILFYYGFIAGICGTIGAIFALKWFPSILVMNLCLMRPIISQGCGIFLNIDEWPGWMTYLGAILVLGAIYWINKGKTLIEKEIQN